MFVDRIHAPTRAARGAPARGGAVAAVVIACAGTLLLSRAAAAPARVPGQSALWGRSHGEIRLDGDGFNVMNVQLVLRSRLRFANPGDDPLDIRIVTRRGRLVKNLLIPAHSHAAWMPVRYGVYVYFNAGTTGFGSVTLMGARQEKIDQPVARKDSSSFPAPAYGVVAVTNAAGGGIALSASHGAMEGAGTGRRTGMPHRAFMNRGPWLEVSGATMTFVPWVLVVRAGQPIHVYNEDSMTHSFYPGKYPVMDEDRDRIRLYRYAFKGFNLAMNGGERSIVFRHAGIHPIVCLIHAAAWKHTYRPYPGYGGYPYVMDAVIVVEPAQAHR
jgi:plastocyanin